MNGNAMQTSQNLLSEQLFQLFKFLLGLGLLLCKLVTLVFSMEKGLS